MATPQLAPTLPSSLFISSPLPSFWQTEKSLANLNLNNMLDKKAVGTPVATAPSSGFTPGFLRRHSASNLHALAHPAPSPGSYDELAGDHVGHIGGEGAGGPFWGLAAAPVVRVRLLGPGPVLQVLVGFTLAPRLVKAAHGGRRAHAGLVLVLPLPGL